MLVEPLITWLLVRISPVELTIMPVPAAALEPMVVLMSTIAGSTLAATAAALLLPLPLPVAGAGGWVGGGGGGGRPGLFGVGGGGGAWGAARPGRRGARAGWSKQ